MKFDLDKMFEETRRTAREYSEQVTGVCVCVCVCVQGRSQDFNKGVSIKIARLRAAKFLKPRPQIGQIVRSPHARTALFQIYVTVILQ